MARKIQFRRGTAASWTSTDPTLAIGELGLETDTGKIKIGDGVTAWSARPYIDAAALAHIADTSAAHAAASIASTPAGTLAATDVQAALNELDTEKAPLASPALTGTPTAPTAATATNTTQVATTAFVRANRAEQAAADISQFVAQDQGDTGGNVKGPGSSVLASITSGANNTAMGWEALTALTTGTGNVAIGNIAGRAITTGVTNVAIGCNTQTANQVGACNVAIGSLSLTNNLGQDEQDGGVGAHAAISPSVTSAACTPAAVTATPVGLAAGVAPKNPSDLPEPPMEALPITLVVCRAVPSLISLAVVVVAAVPALSRPIATAPDALACVADPSAVE